MELSPLGGKKYRVMGSSDDINPGVAGGALWEDRGPVAYDGAETDDNHAPEPGRLCGPSGFSLGGCGRVFRRHAFAFTSPRVDAFYSRRVP